MLNFFLFCIMVDVVVCLCCWCGVLFLLGVVLCLQGVLVVFKLGDKVFEFFVLSLLGGQVLIFLLLEVLKKGLVVLYFYLVVFIFGCIIEVYLFVEVVDCYKVLGVIVIGVLGDNIEIFNKFLVSECCSKFVVVVDVDKKIMKVYDVQFMKVIGYVSCIFYVIMLDYVIFYEYIDMNLEKYVENIMQVLEQWLVKQKC